MSKGGRGPRAALLATLGLAAAGIAATAVLGSEDDGDGPAVRSGGRTVAVTRQTLVERETVQGTLGYAGTRTVLNRLAGSSADDSASDDTPSKNSGSTPDDSPSAGSGTVTALRRPGSVVRRGGVVYRLDGEPVVLMYGSIPTYRDLETGVAEGRDVRQLEENLTSLGFDPGAVDDSFTSTTASAVADWQESAGLPETGSVELGRVVFLPGPRRIGEHGPRRGACSPPARRCSTPARPGGS
ncbi:MAG: peptidoglycan-binding domain-containing protein [Thermoleophilaceae bacterium]